jgi:hypothetical protein
MTLLDAASRDLAVLESYGLSFVTFLVVPILLLVAAGVAMLNRQR